MSENRMIQVEVVYALPQQQKLVPVTLVEGGTAHEAIAASKIMEEFPEIDLEVNKVGIFGKAVKKPGDCVLQDGQRVEIYRPLPKAAKKPRAPKQEK